MDALASIVETLEDVVAGVAMVRKCSDARARRCPCEARALPTVSGHRLGARSRPMCAFLAASESSPTTLVQSSRSLTSARKPDGQFGASACA